MDTPLDHRRVARCLFTVADMAIQKLKAAQEHMEEEGYHDQPFLDHMLEVHAKTLAAAHALLGESFEVFKESVLEQVH